MANDRESHYQNHYCTIINQMIVITTTNINEDKAALVHAAADGDASTVWCCCSHIE